ncbi:hypothetical protein [Streptomyces sp. NBC_00370]|uniref:hypothetical protein n=1 Tax=Streptomyces sp. NBC_00370 TaxID=2975728 RepID=UPI002E271E6F
MPHVTAARNSGVRNFGGAYGQQNGAAAEFRGLLGNSAAAVRRSAGQGRSAWL